MILRSPAWSLLLAIAAASACGGSEFSSPAPAVDASADTGGKDSSAGAAGSSGAGGASGAAGKGGSSGSLNDAGCTLPSDCPATTTPCLEASCQGGACAMKPAADGTACEGGQCVAGECKLVPGAPCDSDELCGTGHCIDGVCCKTDCPGVCMRCKDATSTNPGECLPVANGNDPDAECSGGRVCNGEGACTGVYQCACNTADSAGDKCCGGPACGTCGDESGTCTAHQGKIACTDIGTEKYGYMGPGSGMTVSTSACSSGYACALWKCTCVK